MNNTVTLRPAAPTDINALARLWVVTFPDKFGPTLGDKAERIICDWLRLSERHLETTTVAEINGVVAGYIIWRLLLPQTLIAGDGYGMPYNCTTVFLVHYEALF